MTDIAGPVPTPGSNVETYTRITTTAVRAPGQPFWQIQITWSNPDVPEWGKHELSTQRFPNERAAQVVGRSLALELQASIANDVG